MNPNKAQIIAGVVGAVCAVGSFYLYNRQMKSLTKYMAKTNHQAFTEGWNSGVTFGKSAYLYENIRGIDDL